MSITRMTQPFALTEGSFTHYPYPLRASILSQHTTSVILIVFTCVKSYPSSLSS